MDPGDAPGPSGNVNLNNEIMSQLDQLISTKLVSFENRITESQRNIADSQLNKMKEDMLTNDNYVFKRKSCE